ncbi:mammalian cell entry protein [Mycobacterium sp. PS03-16]|uniref:mammalian cell entry protein n=1 Tax=Mycobacterium sp. PS03-16 TaxID=2559611 RepID=UPI001074324D|nr:mammalian cell entry protein [Mycobacterium sp. PS03-16]TFV54336.1 mammalian cell entry protein [Mycobacterium sp. PS03-16]
MTEDSASNPRPVRRRASRAAGPANGGVSEAQTVPATAAPAPIKVRAARPAGPPPRRRPHRTLVAAVSLGVLAAALVAISTVVAVWSVQQRDAEAAQAREQRFVDTASQTVVNMFSYTQDDIDQSVNRFVDGTSGPLRDMLSQENNVENLKAIFRDTQASSEAVINGAALESVDEVAGNAEVLVSVRVTVTDIDGVNKPTQPYRMRVTVHEDDNGHMTGYDLKYPEGGN